MLFRGQSINQWRSEENSAKKEKLSSGNESLKDMHAIEVEIWHEILVSRDITLLVRLRLGEGGHTGQDQHTLHVAPFGQPNVRVQSVPDKHRPGRVQLVLFLQVINHQGFRLPDHDGFAAGRHFDRAHDATGSGDGHGRVARRE